VNNVDDDEDDKNVWAAYCIALQRAANQWGIIHFVFFLSDNKTRNLDKVALRSSNENTTKAVDDDEWQ